MCEVEDHAVMAKDGKRITFKMPVGIDEKTIQQRGEQLVGMYHGPTMRERIDEEKRRIERR